MRASPTFAVILAIGMGAMTAMSTTSAETVYVIDKLLVGVHEAQTLDGPILKVHPTGTKLEVLERDGDVALVRDAQGDSGWVDSGYLIEAPPALLLVEKLDGQNKQLATALKAARAEIESTKTAASANVQDIAGPLQKANSELKQKLASERLRAGELQAKISELQNHNSTAQAQDSEKVEMLSRENDILRAQLDINGDPNAQAPSGARLAWIALKQSKSLLFGILASVVVLFGSGIYFMDVLHRKRHGGFRI